MINININKDWIPFIVIAVLAFVLLGQCSKVSSLKEDVKILEVDVQNAKANYEASQDTVELYINNNGYLEAEIKTYAASNEELSGDYSKLISKYKKSLDLNKDLKGVNALLSAQLANKDSLLIYSDIKADSTFTFIDSANYGDDNTRIVKIDGKINDGQVQGNLTIKQTITLMAVLENNDGVNSMRLSTKYPFDNMNIQGIDLINNELNIYKKKSRWNVNVGVGYGLYPTAGGTLNANPFIGVVLGYSPKWLQF
jgi:hypothetical protein